ncbi:MAG: hypothetical protein HY791_04115 [Deltaproteobacteria bacterium]|nr:hypothetical protein [Deltaproteobacteria bacterium]
MIAEPGKEAEARSGLRDFAPQVSLGLAFLSLGLLALSPRRYAALAQEDGPIEWATFFAFGIAAVFGGLALFRSKSRPWLVRLALGGLSAFCVFVAGEELSWGQRVFGFRPPDVFLEHNFQQEANLHNFLKKILDTRWVVAFIAIVYGGVLPWLSGDRFRWLDGVRPSRRWVPWFLVIGAAEVFYPFDLIGESAELCLGLVFLADLSERLSPSWPKVVAGHAAAVFLGVITTPLLDGVIEGRGQALVPLAQKELEALAVDIASNVKSKLEKKREVHKRVFTARRSGYFRIPKGGAFFALPVDEDARARRRFYLDPWQQPYWIYILKDDAESRRFVYSFGPNRRRDLDPPSTQASGDDLMVEIR